MSLLDEALNYAAEGFPVFPLAQGTKIPAAGSHGYKDATTDETQILEWWRYNPRFNVAVSTGSASGLFVVDVDKQHGGFESMRALIERHGPLPLTRRCLTPSGGCHIWFRYPGREVEVPSRTGLVGVGIDTKANRAGITAPPSRISTGAYVWLPDYGHAVVDAPEWLVEAAIPRPVDVRPRVACVSSIGSYTRTVFNQEIDKVRCSVGQRNEALSRSAYHIGKLVNAGMIQWATAFDSLLDAARCVGLPDHEARYTIRRAFDKAPAKIRRNSA